jgi:hypothetical protein
MNGELARALAPQQQKVQSALDDLHTHNTAAESPLVALESAGKVIRELQALCDALTTLLDKRDPLNAECGCEQTMEIQGRLRALAELRAR